ncbi:MAG TPA: GEVED domain-containing protein, partial [Flavipsychrobacter sp.]|nr:GEVED domain-containing protein [Flavipsychrobacter sp.]
MKKIYLFVLATVLFFSQSSKAQYALPTYTTGCSSNDFIDNVSTTLGISNITNNASGCNGASPNNYTFFSGMTVSQIQGQSFNFSVQAGTSYGQGFRIWIDWNQDFSFGGPGEDVYVSPNSATTPFTGTITVPFTAVPGVTRMRVLCRYATVPGIGDWNATSMSYGECEDYNMMVIGSTPCSGKPSAGVANYVPGCPATITASGFTLAGGLTWQWQKRVGCTGAWSNINGATSPNFVIPNQTAPTYYRMYIVCTTSGQSDTTAPLFVNSLNPCYCAAGGQYSYYETITNVTINNNSNTTPCINTTYSNFSNLTPTKLSIGQSVPLSVSITNCYGYVYQNYAVAVFIDFDRDGIYSATEKVFASASTVPQINTTALFPSVFQVPTGAKAGITGMRVVLDDYGGTGSSIIGCATPTYGEVEDYLVNIEYVPTVSGDGLHCSSENSFTLASTAPNIGTTSYSYLWQFPDGSYHTDSSYVLPATPGPTGPSGTYTVRVLTYPCGGTGIPDTSGT